MIFLLSGACETYKLQIDKLICSRVRLAACATRFLVTHPHTRTPAHRHTAVLEALRALLSTQIQFVGNTQCLPRFGNLLRHRMPRGRAMDMYVASSADVRVEAKDGCRIPYKCWEFTAGCSTRILYDIWSQTEVISVYFLQYQQIFYIA